MAGNTLAGTGRNRAGGFWRAASACCDFGRRLCLLASAVCIIAPIASHIVSPPTDFGYAMAPLMMCVQGLAFYLLCAALLYSMGGVAQAAGLPKGFEGRWTVLARRIRVLAAALLVAALVETAFAAMLAAIASLRFAQAESTFFLAAFPPFKLWLGVFGIGDGQGEIEALRLTGMQMPIDGAALFSSLSLLAISSVFDAKGRTR